ncbi:WD domain, G-beta repeat domain containing protein [Plasmodium gonderi]|uniref:WD domain, G-beta repeat domain containing protein n=1 Tax=Plasmodium gonderi TaxID=77519 RepID=A0A1Y1JP76_PLAGO|nr:WD domain, G-beta repeat domain containing protein [Plasmodium gonderi]GAW82652.1 WD domain, G-beta repeat domain containing protein [Plasmodium gonderi]
MNDIDNKKFRNISEKVQGKYIPVIKFGGTNKYINKSYKNDSDATNNISFIGDSFCTNNADIYYDNKYGINRVCFSPQGKYVAGCGSNGTIYIYDLYENKLLSKICTKIDNIRDLTISDNDKYIYACGDNKIIEIFDLYENKKKINKDVSKYVDVSIPILIKNKNRKKDNWFNTTTDNNNDAHRNCSNGSNDETVAGLNMNKAKKKKMNMLDNAYVPFYKIKHKNFTDNKVVYVPIYNYNDMIKGNINMVDLNCIKIRKTNQIINKSLFLIKDAHEYSTSCIAVPNISNFLVYSGGGDGLLKIWDIRMNLFALNKRSNKKTISDVVFLDNKNPYASICSHEDVLTSINFNNTINHEGAFKLRRAERKKEIKTKLGKQNDVDIKNSKLENVLHSCKGDKMGIEKHFTDEGDSSSSFSSSCSSVSYSSITFDLTKNKFNNILMTSGYDGYIRLYDINNNIIKSFYDEEKSITHCMFSYNNKYIISTNKSKYTKVFDFIYFNNKKNAKNMATYLTNYKSYYLNKQNDNNQMGHELNEYSNCGTFYDDKFSKDIYNDKEFHPCNIKNIYEDKELEERIKHINELNREINKSEEKKPLGSSDEGMIEKKIDSDGTYSNTDSSDFDENTIKTNTFYEHVNKKLEPTWSLFVDNMKYMNLIPYDEINESLKKNHEYVKEHYKNLHRNIDSSDHIRDYNCDHKNLENQTYSLQKDEKNQVLYYELSDIIHKETEIPKFYSCVAGDKCIIPSIDTYAHVYDIYTGFHVNTISNLYLPNYHIDHSYFDSHSLNEPFFKKRQLSFLTSADTYPKNQNIIATSNGYPDGSIVVWIFAPF